MDHFHYQAGDAYCERVKLREIAATLGTPAYVYSRATLARHCSEFKDAFSGHPTYFCYAIKANGNLGLLKEIFSHGFGADIVSLGELERALLAGVDVKKLVYSGVGKREDEIVRALELGIFCINVESFFELELIAKVSARLKKKAPISLRLNPNIDAKTHPKIATGLHSTKFGIAVEEVPRFLEFLKKHRTHLEFVGLDCHIGSQLLDLGPIQDAVQQMLLLVDSVRSQGFPIRHLNMGGGLGIRYTNENPPSIKDYAKILLGALRGKDLTLLLEPGRVLVGNSGVLLMSVMGIKETAKKNFAIVDAAMNDLLRPTLYGAQHEICSVQENEASKVYDVVGPVCETGDYLALDQQLPLLRPGDLLYARTCGAYGFCMSSHYNSRPRPVEIMVDGATVHVVRKREKLSDLWRGEI